MVLLLVVYIYIYIYRAARCVYHIVLPSATEGFPRASKLSEDVTGATMVRPLSSTRGSMNCLRAVQALQCTSTTFPEIQGYLVGYLERGPNDLVPYLLDARDC